MPGSENRYRLETLQAGVTCEKCHGPGREHAAYHRAHPEEQEARAVVRPAMPSRERLLDVCGQCHGNVVRPRRPAFSYRPGEPVEESFQTLRATGPENDHVANQVKYLQESKCFQKSDGLICVACHNPHRKQAAGRRACLECHQPSACKERERLPAEAPAEVRDGCVACHLPGYNRVAITLHAGQDKFVFPVRPSQHRIGIYSEATKAVLLGWRQGRTDEASRQEAARLEGELEEQWLAEAARLRQEHRYLPALGAAREAVAVGDSAKPRAVLTELARIQEGIDQDLRRGQQQFAARRFPEAVQVLKGVLAVKPELASAHSKLGTAYAVLGEREVAEEHLALVGQYDPDDAYGDNMRGWLAYLAGENARAADLFREADERLPFSSEINERWGLALAGLEKWPEAEARFRQVLQIDPGHVEGCQDLSRALVRQGRAGEALELARRAAGLTGGKDAGVMLDLAEVYRDLGRQAEADAARAQAQEAARLTPPGGRPPGRGVR